MRIVIVGVGKVGASIAQQLSLEGHDIYIIDKNPRVVESTMNILDGIGVVGNGACLESQTEAETGKSDLLIAATASDETNLLCCLLAKKLGSKHTIARVRNHEYREQLKLLKEDLGLSFCINPELFTAQEISRILRFPVALKVDNFVKGTIELVEYKISEDSPLVGLPLSALYQKYKVKVLICAVERGEEAIIPNGDFVLGQGDRIHITASPSQIAAFFKEIGTIKQKIKSVMIIGGGKISFYLSKILIAMGMQVKIIEKDTKRCDELSCLVPEAMIINGDGTDAELLSEEGMDTTDAFVSLTGMDEENIIISMFANNNKVKKVVTKINRQSYVEIMENVNLGSIVTPKEITTDHILRYVRAMRNSWDSKVETLYRIADNKAEVLEFQIKDEAKFTSISLKVLQLKKNTLIAAIYRKGRVIIPGGEDTIEAGDNVVVVTGQSGIRAIEHILE